MRPAGSRARQAFAAAQATLAAYEPAAADLGPPLSYRVPGPGPAAGHDEPARPGRRGRPGSGDIGAAAAALRAGRLTCAELVEDALQAVGKFDPELNAVAHLLAGEARAAAAALDAEAAAGRWRGPLHGVPVTVKDVIDVAGAPTRAGSLAFERWPERDAEAVARLRAAGAVVIAKVTTHEFALGVTSPQSRNPHDRSRIPGGSSGGSAIAVSTGMGLASIGTDTRASIRAPAALTGVVGFKATFGAVPTGGVVPLSWSMDHVAPMATTVADAATVLDALARPPRPLADWAGAPVAGLRLGVVAAGFDGAPAEVAGPVEDAVAALARLGATVGPAGRPSAGDLERANAAGLVVSRCEAAAYHRHLGTDRALYWDEVADQLDAAGGVSAVDYIDAQRLRGELAATLLATFGDFDVLAMPTAPVVAPPRTDFSRHLLALSRNAIPWSLTGLPAVSIPCGRAGGLPVGIQLVAPPWREARLVAAGTALEAAL